MQFVLVFFFINYVPLGGLIMKILRHRHRYLSYQMHYQYLISVSLSVYILVMMNLLRLLLLGRFFVYFYFANEIRIDITYNVFLLPNLVDQKNSDLRRSFIDLIWDCIFAEILLLKQRRFHLKNYSFPSIFLS